MVEPVIIPVERQERLRLVRYVEDDLTNVFTLEMVETRREARMINAFEQLSEEFIAFNGACRSNHPCSMRLTRDAYNEFVRAVVRHGDWVDWAFGSRRWQKLVRLTRIVEYIRKELVDEVVELCGMSSQYTDVMGEHFARFDRLLLVIEGELDIFKPQ